MALSCSNVLKSHPSQPVRVSSWKPTRSLAGAGIMERQWSLEDFNSMWKLGAGFPRNDSENAFQDFLKRIPSTTNLAAQAGQHLDQQQQAQLHQQVQHLQQQSAQQQGIQYLSRAWPPWERGGYAARCCYPSRTIPGFSSSARWSSVPELSVQPASVCATQAR